MRIAIFASASTVAGAFGELRMHHLFMKLNILFVEGGLLAAAISNMEGVGGKPAWSWIFILEGVMTVAAASISLWMIEDFPNDARFLSEDESTRLHLAITLDYETIHLRSICRVTYAGRSTI